MELGREKERVARKKKATPAKKRRARQAKRPVGST